MWEAIDTFTDRMKVPGGWIVRSSFSHRIDGEKGASVTVACHQIFIADVDHAWPLQQQKLT